MDARLLILLGGIGLGLAVAAIWRRRKAQPPAPVIAPRRETATEDELSRLFVTLAGTVDDGLLVVETDRRISFANSAVGQLLGTMGGPLRGQTVMTGLRDFQA